MFGIVDSVWRLQQSSPCAQRCWEEECGVYAPESGDTHLLSALAVAILDDLAERPRTQHEIENRVAALLGCEPGAELRDSLAALLAQLFKIGLVERLEADS